MQTFPSVLDDQVRPLKRAEYDRLVDLGVFAGERVELLYGRIVEMPPQGDEHAGSIDVLTELLVVALVGRARVRVQLPFIASDESEPEPDVAVVPVGDPFAGHPDRAFLILEVSKSSQDKDRGPKGALYAASGVPEFWVVDVANRRVERYLHPLEGRYAVSSIHGPEETLTLSTFPDVEIALRTILPPTP
jgi:Uma2 family endonuclease